MFTTLKDFIESDLKTLPTEALKSINLAVQNELAIRRRECKQPETLKQDLMGHGFLHHKVPNKHWGKYYDILMGQDWSGLFQGGDTEPKYYVYAHVSPSKKYLKFHSDETKEINLDGIPFYIGKGCGDRAFDLKRNQGHGEILKELKRAGVGSDKIVRIIFDGLTEAKALEIESKLIYFFGTKYERGRYGILVNLDIPPKPELTHNKM